MERRPYFVMGDLVANAATGALVGCAAAALVGPHWHSLLAMGLGMLGGMLLSLIASFAFVPFFGAHEVMVPVMTTGMAAGMVVAMQAAMGGVGLAAAMGRGAGIGLAVVVACSALDAWIRRRAGP